MSGGLLQLIAYGAQDTYLTGQPQITFFKVVYRRHTNFSMEPIQQNFNGIRDFGGTITLNINKNADLITKMHLVIDLKDIISNNEWGYVDKLGFSIIETVKLEIGPNKMDIHYGNWLNIYNELTRNNSHDNGFSHMIGDIYELKQLTKNHPKYKLYIPLQFWFNRNNGLALPLIALQHHEVKITIKLRDALDCINYKNTITNLPQINDIYLLTDYIFLDSEERKKFAQSKHEYLIEQVQFSGSETVTLLNSNYILNFNHPCKYLIWTLHLGRYIDRSQYIVYAFDNNWNYAKDLFAKLIWLATRTGLTYDTQFTINIENNGLDEIVNIDSTVLKTLIDKVNATIITVDNNNIASATTDNVMLLSNLLTIQDITLNLHQIITDITDTNIINFLSSHSIYIKNYFNYGNYINGEDNPIVSAGLQLNGHQRFQTRDGSYFNYVQPDQYFSNTPSDGINVYSFALKPEEHQPSGTCNFSRIDSTLLNLSFGNNNIENIEHFNNFIINNLTELNVFTVNYNILKIMSGRGGLAYSS